MVLSVLKMNPFRNAFRGKDLVPGFFLLGEFSVLLEQKLYP